MLVPDSSIIGRAIIYIHTYFIIQNFCSAKILNYKISMYVYDRATYNALVKVKVSKKGKKYKVSMSDL